MNSVRSQYHVRMGILKDLQPYGNNFALWAAGRPGQCILHYVWVLRSNCVRAGTFFLHHVPTYIRLSMKWKASKYLIGVLGSNPHYLSVMLQVSIGGRNWPSDFNHFPKLNFLKVTSNKEEICTADDPGFTSGKVVVRSTFGLDPRPTDVVNARHRAILVISTFTGHPKYGRVESESTESPLSFTLGLPVGWQSYWR